MHRLHAFVVSLVLLLASVGARADVRPDEMTSRPIAQRLELHYPRRFEPAARRIEQVAPKTVRAVEQSLGLKSLGKVQVWILPEVNDYFEVTHSPGGPPKWAVGLSLSHRGVVIVVNGTGPHGERVDLIKTFQHELAHVGIDRARGNHPVPRWFNEGFALMQAHEWTPERAEIFSRAASAGSLKPFAQIERSFPAEGTSAGLAYAQSLQFVMYMRDTGGAHVFARIMKEIRDGQTFDQAFAHVVGKSFAVAESQWRRDVQKKSSWWSILNDGTWGFFGASFLFVVAWLVRRKRVKKKLAAMQDDPTGWDYDESRYPLPGSPRDV